MTEPRYETGMDYRTRVWNGNAPVLMAEIAICSISNTKVHQLRIEILSGEAERRALWAWFSGIPMKRVCGCTDRREVVHERKRPRTLQTRWTTNLEHVHSEWLRPLEKTASLLGGRRRWRCKRWLRSATTEPRVFLVPAHQTPQRFRGRGPQRRRCLQGCRLFLEMGQR